VTDASEFSDVLAESIEAIERGKLTSEECLEKYPAYADNLGDLLPVMAMLRDAPPVEPSQAFQQQSPQRLLAQLETPVHENVTFLQALRHKWQSTQSQILLPKRMQRMAWTIILTIFVTFMASTGVLYAADSAVPGDPLYKIDRSLEALQLSMTHNLEDNVSLRLAQAEERLVEAQTLAERADEENLQNALADYSESILSAGQAVKAADGQEREALLLLFDDALQQQDAILTDLLDDEPGDDFNEDAERCTEDEDYSQAEAIAEAEGVTLEQVKAWYCSGYGYGEIKLAFKISAQTDFSPEELLQFREDLGWGEIMQAAGLIGSGKIKSGDPVDEEDFENYGGWGNGPEDLDDSDNPINSNDPGDDDDPYDPEDPGDDEWDDENGRCASGEIHPQAQAIADANDAPVEQIMEWFCSGLGFGEIKLAFKISDQTEVSTDELVEMRGELGWGQIMQEAGLISNKDDKQTGPSDDTDQSDKQDLKEKKDKDPKDTNPSAENGSSTDQDSKDKKDKEPNPNKPADNNGSSNNQDSKEKKEKDPKDKNSSEDKNNSKDNKSSQVDGPNVQAELPNSSSSANDAKEKNNPKSSEKQQPAGKDNKAEKKEKD
jgi:hypothetical protein